MGYLVIHYPQGAVLLGDENQYRRDQALPHYDRNGRYVSQRDIERQDETGA